MDVRIFQPTSTELHAMLPELTVLINDAFAGQDRSSYKDEVMFEGNRMDSEDQLIAELGDQGMAAIAFDTTSELHAPVAIACVKPWKGKLIDLWHKQHGAVHARDSYTPGPNDWEVATCVSKRSPQYRGKGLVVQCLDAVYGHLRQIRELSGQPITLWITALEGVGNVEYWHRRGFSRYGAVDDAPVGLWGARCPFQIGTLKKDLD